ncbi:MAG: NepR family anti-sigma factor [Neoaquamicrobium sediminum]|uniref:NepR family anti-sigma factor n=1 Tax=Neoaquamicrobium sediminum TaxID=1849104 RepID=A0ABV3WVR8_9HYPH
MKPNIAAATGGQKKPGRSSETLGPNSEIGRKLKQYYDDLVSDEVPDRFANLLKQLEESENSGATPAGEGQ